jgi:hypothetical protein
MLQQHEDRVSRSLRQDFELLLGINKLFLKYLLFMIVLGVGALALLATVALFSRFLGEHLVAVLFWAGIIGVVVYSAWTSRRKN